MCSSMLSNFVSPSDERQTVLQLVNYSGYPVENVTVHFGISSSLRRLLAPGVARPLKLDLYEVDEGSGVDIASVDVAATLVLPDVSCIISVMTRRELLALACHGQHLFAGKMLRVRRWRLRDVQSYDEDLSPMLEDDVRSARLAAT